VALLIALVLLALSAALATATFSAARAMRRAALTTLVQVRVETGVRRTFGEVLAGWTPAFDTIPVGSGLEMSLTPEPGDTGPPLVRRARLVRVAAGLYAVTVDVRASGSLPWLARRRARLWLERPTAAAGANPEAAPLPPPVVVTDWPFADLY
jgi:hypothetical protein